MSCTQCKVSHHVSLHKLNLERYSENSHCARPTFQQKNRKIKCDRERPICGSCVRRGIPPQQCLLGDGRDDYEQIMSAPPTEQVSTLMKRIARLEEELRVAQSGASEAGELSRDDADEQRRWSAAKALREENLSVAGQSSISLDAMDHRLQVDREIADSHARDRLRAASGSQMMSSATSFALGAGTSPIPVEDMISFLPPESSLLSVINFYYDEFDVVYGYLASRATTCKRVEDLWRRAASKLSTPAAHSPSPSTSSIRQSIAQSIAGSIRSAGQRSSPAQRNGPAESESSSFSPSDYAFLAMIFALVEVCAEIMSDAQIIEHRIAASAKEIPAILGTYHRHCCTLLSMSDMLAQPTLEALQALQLISHYYLGRQRRTEYTVINTVALRMAEGMGLHKLTTAKADAARWKRQQGATNDAQADDQGTRSPQEQASSRDTLPESTAQAPSLHGWFLPQGKHQQLWQDMNASRWQDGNHVMRELGRKVFWQLVFTDWQLAALHDGVYHCTDGMYTTGLPLNASLTDIARAENPLDVASSDVGIVEIMASIGRATRGIADAMNAGQSTYKDMKRIEADHRAILDMLPPYLRFDVPPDSIAQVHTRKPYLAIQRVVVHMYVYHRLLKLHRLYMPRAYRRTSDTSDADAEAGPSPKDYRESAEICLESADVILSCFRELVQADSPLHRLWAFRMWVFDAACTLQIDLLFRIAQPAQEETTLKRQADVEMALRLLEPRTTLERTGKFSHAAKAALKALQTEEKRKRQAMKRQLVWQQLLAKRKAEEEGANEQEKLRAQAQAATAFWREQQMAGHISAMELQTSWLMNDNVSPKSGGPALAEEKSKGKPSSPPLSALASSDGRPERGDAEDTSDNARAAQELLAQLGDLSALDTFDVVAPDYGTGIEERGPANPSTDLTAEGDTLGGDIGSNLLVNDLDTWLKSVSQQMISEAPGPANMGGSMLLDRLINEMEWAMP